MTTKNCIKQEGSGEHITQIGYVTGNLYINEKKFHDNKASERARTYLGRFRNEIMQRGMLRLLKYGPDHTADERRVKVEDVYTPLNTQADVIRNNEGQIIRQSNHKERRDQESSKLTALEAANHYSRLVLLGDPGSGKSTFVGYLALSLGEHILNPEGEWLARLEKAGWAHGTLFPVFVTLREFSASIPSEANEGTAELLWKYIAEYFLKKNCAEAVVVVRQVLLDGQALVLLDGLDEVPSEKRNIVRDSLEDFMSTHRENRYITTCRILSYKASDNWHLADMTVETLAPFDPDQIVHFVRAWYTVSQQVGNMDADIAQRRIDDLTQGLNHPHLGTIASNPMLLTVMAVVHSSNGRLPRQSAALYKECVEIMMTRWREEAATRLNEDLDIRDPNDLYRILWEIAYEAHDEQAESKGPANILEKNVVNVANRYLNSWKKAKIFCDYVAGQAGLLSGLGTNAKGDSTFAFPHRTFQEYLAGCHIANNEETFAKMIRDKAQAGVGWREVTRLAIGHKYFNQASSFFPITAVEEIELIKPIKVEDWQAVSLAGEILVLMGLDAVRRIERGENILPKIQKKLQLLLDGGHLQPVERAEAGKVLGQLGDLREGVGLKDGLPEFEWLEILEGDFIYQDCGRMPVDYFWITKYPVTYAQYEPFVEETGKEPKYWLDPKWHVANHPVVGVNWYDAVAYCDWLSDRLQLDIRLPTEQEWERVARGTNGRKYPWGEKYKSGFANIDETENGGLYYLNQTSAVGMYPSGATPEGVYDLSGNVWEWCLNKYEKPNELQVGRDADPRVLRGGSWDHDEDGACATYRNGLTPDSRNNDVGFRVVLVSNNESRN